jgi:hypothetical protein
MTETAGPGMGPTSAHSAAELIDFGWEIAESTLATAASELTLVTHWFQTGEDDSVNADDHFGSDERTLRFLTVALPTLIDQLNASMAVVAVPWELESPAVSLSVLAIVPGAPAVLATRTLTRLEAGVGGPFWRLEPGPRTSPAQLALVASALVA